MPQMSYDLIYFNSFESNKNYVLGIRKHGKCQVWVVGIGFQRISSNNKKELE